MTDNIFMISDASYSSHTICAGLGVIDLHTGKKYSHSTCNIENSYLAEYRALLLSIRIAIANGYDNVVFVYDNKSLNLDTLKLWLVDKINSYQFLWLKRTFIDDADKLAKKARSLQEKLITKEALCKTIDDTDLVSIFKRYSQHKIIRAFMSIANDTEYKILKAYRDNKSYLPILVDENSLDFFSDIYHLLASNKSKKHFYKFIDKNYSNNIDITEFQKPKSNEHYVAVIKKIVNKLSYIDVTVQKGITETPKEIINKIKIQSFKEIGKFCIKMAKGHDKELLYTYFNAKKFKEYNMNKDSVELFLFVHYLLPKKYQYAFFAFIRNRLKRSKKLSRLFFVRNEEFYLNYLCLSMNLK